MDESAYFKDRVQDQIDWYDKKSQSSQKWYKRLRTTEIVCAAVIPFLAGFSDIVPHNQLLIGTLGIVIAVCAGISSLNKLHENWLTYRTTCETLKHEKYLFLTKCKPYDTEAAFEKFVTRVENLISKENSQWSRTTKERQK
ncbi:DUF4231 domain-containing protein [Marinomonas mediterranea]|uniref:DUF4231 domain-containing protein n=1 Tax=Marinomonas mediterranea TaxID=119864 RepID=UPI00234A31E5|nr:DUF4231 domain-containing protein [Marinomonas mediterranea]WCN12766.1 DUF4231 domain-containing protein [Marinomonas mediterranea]